MNRNYPFPVVILSFWLAGLFVFWQILNTSSWNRFRFPCTMPRVNLQVNCFWDFNSKHQRRAFGKINLGILRWHFRDEKWKEGTGSKALKPSPGSTEHHGTQLSSNSGSCSHGFRTDPQAREGFTFCSPDIGTRADMRHAKNRNTCCWWRANCRFLKRHAIVFSHFFVMIHVLYVQYHVQICTVYCSCDSWDTCWPAVTSCHHSWGWHNTNIHVLAQATCQRNTCKRHVALAAVDASSLGQIFDILSTFQLLQYFLLNYLPRPSLAWPCGLRAFGASLWISGTAKPERRTALWPYTTMQSRYYNCSMLFRYLASACNPTFQRCNQLSPGSLEP